MKTRMLLALSVLLFACAKKTTEDTSLSFLPFDVTGSKEAMPNFQKGLLLLHNFEYPDALEAFREAQRKDPGFAMAYWGEAMTFDHPVWDEVNVEKGRAAIAKLGASKEERLSKTKSDFEKDFIAGLEILYGDGSKPEREVKYSKHMETVYRRYPASHEAAAFYALSLLAIKKGWSEWEAENAQAAKICEAILKENPNHPGALHYLVHADDHPQYAKNGLPAANKYAKVASYAGHALHMPSHIYLAMGMWDQVVSSNEVSWQASIDRKTKKGLDNDALNYHAHTWLQYGYLQQGRNRDAKKLLENQIRFTSEKTSPKSIAALVQLRGQYLFGTNDWQSSFANLKTETNDLEFGVQDNNTLISASSAFYNKDIAALERIIDDYEKKLAKLRLVAKDNDKVTICSTQRYINSIATSGDVDRGDQYLNEFKALRAWLKSDGVTAEDFFKKALPQKETFISGPPDFFKSPFEFYGEFLIAQNRPAEAYEQYQKSLIYSPRRMVALKGSLAAARLMKDQQKISAAQDELSSMMKNADQELKIGL